MLLDQSRCRGYRECVKGCPYKKVYFNAADARHRRSASAATPPSRAAGRRSARSPASARSASRASSARRTRRNEDNPLDYLVFVKKLALPLYPQFGLEPNTYYIPPVHVPPPSLRQMFGWGVEQAIATYRTAADDRKLLGALTLFGATPEISHYFRVDGDDGHRLRRQAGRDRAGAAPGARAWSASSTTSSTRRFAPTSPEEETGHARSMRPLRPRRRSSPGPGRRRPRRR